MISTFKILFEPTCFDILRYRNHKACLYACTNLGDRLGPLVWTRVILIIRPADVVIGGLRFYCDSIFFIFSSATPATSMNGNKPKLATCPEVRGCYLKMCAENLEHPYLKNQWPLF